VEANGAKVLRSSLKERERLLCAGFARFSDLSLLADAIQFLGEF